MLKMLKPDLEKENSRLTNLIVDFSKKDEVIRENLSGFLGSYKQDRYSQTMEVKTLSWPEIYFELGKLQMKDSNYEEVRELNVKIMRIAKEVEDMKKGMATDRPDKDICEHVE